MSFDFLLQGILLGFAIAAPVGPIGVLCIRKTLASGRLAGISSGVGAALADATYACIAAFGLTFISSLLLAGQFWFQLVGGGFLLYLGWKTFSAKPNAALTHAPATTLFRDLASTFALTISSPMTVLTFLGLFSSLGFSSVESGYAEATKLVLGVFLGSACWWLILCEGVTLFRKKVSQRVMIWINRISGICIAGFGLLALLSIRF